MIFGVFERAENSHVDAGLFRHAGSSIKSASGELHAYTEGRIGFSYHVPFMTLAYQHSGPAASIDKNIVVNFTGRIYNTDELLNALDSEMLPVDTDNPSSLVAALYKQFGMDFVNRLNGKFAFALWDKTRQELILGRDRFGIEPLYYYVSGMTLIFSSAIKPIFAYAGTGRDLNPHAISKFLLFNYNPGMQTFFNDVHKLRPAHLLRVSRKDLAINRYWNLSFSDVTNNDEREIAEHLVQHLRDAVSLRIDPDLAFGVFLSGGMDSSTIIALAKESSDSPPSSFSYRCKSESYDESHYARMMSEFTASTHYETVYSSQDVTSMQDLVREMNEPFCDVGINLATHILGREAHNKVSFILTGDGGDELFGGHPVYEADKMAGYADAVPGFIKHPLMYLSSFLPDSDKKKNIIVKVKRFAESLKLPPELLSHRWRTYYHPDELHRLMSESFASEAMNGNLYADIYQFNEESDGCDLLSKALYSDYQTAVDFYLRRNDLNRMFNLETRYPLLDHRLAEYCARIPSGLKINGWFDTKYIFKKAMEQILPHDIVYRKDKLGHSIPLKNWIRDDRQVREFVFDFISEDSINKRKYFHYSYVNNMVKDHLSMKRNNSHRLWSLAVLEMWMREHVDS